MAFLLFGDRRNVAARPHYIVKLKYCSAAWSRSCSQVVHKAAHMLPMGGGGLKRVTDARNKRRTSPEAPASSPSTWLLEVDGSQPAPKIPGQISLNLHLPRVARIKRRTSPEAPASSPSTWLLEVDGSQPAPKIPGQISLNLHLPRGSESQGEDDRTPSHPRGYRLERFQEIDTGRTRTCDLSILSRAP